MPFDQSFDEFSAQLDRLKAAFLSRITLKSLKHHSGLSEDSNAFTATVYWDGKKLAHARDSGQGGCIDIDPTNEAEKERLTAAEAEIEAHADGDRSSLEYLVGTAVERDLRLRDNKKALRGGKIAWITAGSPNEITSVKWPALAQAWPASKPEFMAEAKTSGWITDPSLVTFLNDTVMA